MLQFICPQVRTGRHHGGDVAGLQASFVPFESGRPDGQSLDVLTAFVDAWGVAQGWAT